MATDALAELIPFNNRVLIANFGGNPETAVTIHYAPCEGGEDAEECYNNLENAAPSMPKHNMILVAGDCNAHLGSEDALYSFHKETNKNGELLIDFALENNLMITNTRFYKKQGKLWTYISDMGPIA